MEIQDMSYNETLSERFHSIDTKMKGNPLSLEEMILMTIYSWSWSSWWPSISDSDPDDHLFLNLILGLIIKSVTILTIKRIHQNPRSIRRLLKGSRLWTDLWWNLCDRLRIMRTDKQDDLRDTQDDRDPVKYPTSRVVGVLKKYL